MERSLLAYYLMELSFPPPLSLMLLLFVLRYRVFSLLYWITFRCSTDSLRFGNMNPFLKLPSFFRFRLFKPVQTVFLFPFENIILPRLSVYGIYGNKLTFSSLIGLSKYLSMAERYNCILAFALINWAKFTFFNYDSLLGESGNLSWTSLSISRDFFSKVYRLSIVLF